MHKNRRKHHRSPSSKLIESKSKPKKHPFFMEDKQNEAKHALLDMGNDDTMLHIDVARADQNPSRNSLIDQMKVHQTQILGRLSRNTKKKIYSDNQIHPLLPIDNNCDFEIDNFVEDKARHSSTKNKLFSLRNTFYNRSKDNIITLRKELQTRKQEKTILKLKKILKKLQSPQKTKNLQEQNQQRNQLGLKNKKSFTKINEFCTQFIHRKKSSSKQRTIYQLGSNQKGADTPTQNTMDSMKVFELRSGCKTSHQKYRACVTPIPITSSPAPFFYKPTKLTNKSILFKRHEVSTAQIIHQKNYCTSIKKFSTRIGHQGSKSSMEDLFGEELMVQNSKKKEDRKNRNLKNILFD